MSRNTTISALKKTVKEGIISGAVRNFDPKKHLKKLKAAREKMANHKK